MSKLKTLHDIEDELTTTVIFPDDLRSLAKEWIKKLEGINYIENNELVRNWIKHFFNLEED